MTRPGETREPLPVREPPLEPFSDRLDGPTADHLLAAAGRGDVEALANLYELTAPVVFGVLRGVSRSVETTEQATERVYVHLWRAAPQFDPDRDTAYSLLMRTARREMAHRLAEAAACGSLPRVLR